jgi:hypothetical protein
MRFDKKAKVTVSIIDNYAILLLAVGLLILIPLFGLRSCSVDKSHTTLLQNSILEADANTALRNMLRANVVLDNSSNITMADLIVLWKHDNDKYKTELEKQLDVIFKTKDSSCVLFFIDEEEFLINDCFGVFVDYNEDFSQQIPNIDGSVIKIALNPNPEKVE